MRSITRPAGGVPAATRIVCLPGAYHSPEDLLAAGFESRVRARGLAIDLTFVDAELAHLRDRRFREALGTDIITPARAAGCAAVWLAGISLGGFMALDFAATHPHAVDGLCLLAPYLGNRMLTREIARSTVLAAGPPGDAAAEDEERRVWRFMQTGRTPALRVYLGYGREDRFAAAHDLLAARLAPSEVRVVPGGHDFPTWTRLWEDFLDTRFT